MKITKALSVIITILITLALGVILQEIFHANGWLTLVALAQAAVIIFGVSKFLQWHFKMEDEVNKYDEDFSAGQIRNAIHEVKQDFCRICADREIKDSMGIIKSAELPDLERKCSDEIWILASDLHTEKRDDIKQLVRGNLQRGIRYKYFISDDLNVEADAQKLIEEFYDEIKAPTDYEFYLIKTDYFFFIDGLDIVIYDPMELDQNAFSPSHKVAQGRRAYVSIQSEQDNTWYEIPLSDNLIDELILTIQNHMNDTENVGVVRKKENEETT